VYFIKEIHLLIVLLFTKHFKERNVIFKYNLEYKEYNYFYRPRLLKKKACFFQYATFIVYIEWIRDHLVTKKKGGYICHDDLINLHDGMAKLITHSVSKCAVHILTDRILQCYCISWRD